MTGLETQIRELSIYRLPPHDTSRFFGVSPAINLAIQNELTSPIKSGTSEKNIHTQPLGIPNKHIFFEKKKVIIAK